MKAKLFPGLTSLVVTITLVASFPSFATHHDTGTLIEDGTLVPILLQNPDALPGGAPRTAVPFFAEYFDTLSAVMLGSSESIGDVTVRLTSTAGDWYQTEFDTSDGAILVPASGLSGHYVLTIETSDHTVYEGEFYL